MPSLVAGEAGLGGQHRSAPGQRFQAGGAENVGRPIRQRGFPDEEVRPRGPMSEGKRSRRDSAPLTFVGWCRGVRGQSASCPRPHRPPVHPRQGMNSRLLRRALPKAWAVSGASAGPESPTQRSALGQPGALDHPAPDPPPRAPHGVRPRAPGKHSQTSRTTAPPQYLSHVPRFSLRMSVLTPDSSPLVPVCPRKPAPARLVPPAGEHSARRVCGCSPRPATRGAPWVLSPPR